LCASFFSCGWNVFNAACCHHYRGHNPLVRTIHLSFFNYWITQLILLTFYNCRNILLRTTKKLDIEIIQLEARLPVEHLGVARLFLHQELLPLVRQSLAERQAVLGDGYQSILHDLRTMVSNPDEYRVRRPGWRRTFRHRLSTYESIQDDHYESIQDDHYEFLPMIDEPYEVPLRRTASAPYDVLPIPENQDVNFNAATAATQICVAEVHFDNRNAEEDSGPIPGFCLADVNFDVENIGDESNSSGNLMSMSDKGNGPKSSQDKHTVTVTEFCIAELNFSDTEVNETDDLELTELVTQQDGATTNEIYETLQKPTELGFQQDEASTNEIYETLQKTSEMTDLDHPDLNDSNECPTQVE
jgi:hypothetical protein